jgi:hypothetical protein
MGKEMMVSLTMMIVGAASLAAVLALFWNVKRETAALGRRLRQDRKETVMAVELIRAAMSRLEADVAASRRDVEQLPAMAATAPVGNSMNVSKRTQALRMHRRGEPLDKIATVLGIPHREVELLVKLQDVVRYGASASA